MGLAGIDLREGPSPRSGATSTVFTTSTWDPLETHVVEGTFLAFRLAWVDRDRASDLVKKPYGQRTSSHGGTYVYRRKGLLDEIPHVRLIHGVIIVRTEDAERVRAFLAEIDAEVQTSKVELEGRDREALTGRRKRTREGVGGSSAAPADRVRCADSMNDKSFI